MLLSLQGPLWVQVAEEPMQVFLQVLPTRQALGTRSVPERGDSERGDVQNVETLK